MRTQGPGSRRGGQIVGLSVRKAATIATMRVSAPNPTPIARSAFSSATMAPSGLLHEQVGDATEHEHGGDGPKQNDWHCSLLWLSASIISIIRKPIWSSKEPGTRGTPCRGELGPRGAIRSNNCGPNPTPAAAAKDRATA